MLASLSLPITVRMASCLDHVPGEDRSYRIVGEQLAADVSIDFLAPYEDVLNFGSPWPAGAGLQASATHEQAATGWLAGCEREVRCVYSDTEIVIDVEGIGKFRVARPSGGIACLEADPGVSRALLEETLLGPPLSFALILRDIWCLHASAVLTERGAVLFLGASGQGKSTLADWLARSADFVSGRLADDIVPCSCSSGSALAHCHFPQLKLPEDQQYPMAAPVNQPIRALVMVQKAGAGEKPVLEAVAPSAMAKLIAEQSIGVKLFDREVHRRHLAWVAELIAATDCGVLQYPHERQQLPQVAERLHGFLEQ